MSAVRFSVLPGTFAVCRLPARAAIPAWAGKAFTAITRTEDELSIVVDASRLPANRDGVELQVEGGWTLLKVEGPLPFEAIGILASLTKALADAAISVFAISTFETDYLLVKKTHAKQAIAALTLAGHRLADD